MGYGCHIGTNVTFDTIRPSAFNIGNNVTITMNTVLLVHGLKIDDITGEHKYPIGQLTIGDNVFVGAGSIITKPLKIGEHSVIAAGSVVTKDVPPYTIVAGCPAKVIRKLSHKNENYGKQKI